ncbi:MAG: GNAT family N-acetyltransferase [Tessaracoccus sp.]|uniref:GNAT family N-acetyltransferase n=1 Tax=Tessaracoccus sp. TaxID=1971211 RepID=UPI001EC65532|nr:GNAT family N-acetyltransferase [Tessaracoccus sp.]MBK7820731.1 GNAT family N-acetyltransferase [Tessaracoccus sp.]
MTVRLRTLGTADRELAASFLAESPTENLFLAAKVASFGLDRRRLGRVHAFERDGRVSALLLDGGTVFVAGFDPEALPAFVAQLGPIRRCTSILGPVISVLGLHLGLTERWPTAWGNVVNVRRRQPLMLLQEAPRAEPDARVRVLTPRDYPSYLDASVGMYTEEIGSSPFKYGGGYEKYVMERLRRGDAYGIVGDSGRVIFKADLGPQLGTQAQLQGVWVTPELRGTGLSVPALAGMLRLARSRFPSISLYVNDFNAPAIRAYERLGFEEVGALATVHY